ncbi:hypothetical protein LTR91_015082 [Friedmanniomyces endolithicus]|uniref:NmrA-like domain-containing protein n=1 Tax=Friedmanniomyces endolithicus TaxID=329885 RepID=A0AAN6QMJ7_9PEZI|nr:hypothetical protein LTR57_004744 [Friedmanniomyces endolithicus]KAK0972537.1 hypothetical protein LTR91_015082 [Friedmanniomyces endolithicus]KAK1009418.1 hypothetical protein LTS01_001909 [Friedmanniomyces endolithicus]
MSSNYITKIAIVGAGGRSGGPMASELLKTGRHTVTAITREDSTSTLPPGVQTAKVNYDDQASLVTALQGQDALIITMGTQAPPDTQSKLLRAAAEAGVPWVLPNEWSPDTTNAGLCRDVFIFAKAGAVREEIRKLGVSSYLAVTTGFWYEWSLAIPDAFGFDFEGKTVTLFDEGETRMNISTWPQVGRAVAALLSLPIKAGGGGKEEACMDYYRDGQVYVSSFCVSQRDMLASVLRVTGDKGSDWTIKKERAVERFEAAREAMQKGDRMAFARWMYTRVFYPDGSGEYGKTKGLANEVLKLPEESIDEATKAAMERARTNPYA